MRKRNVPPLKKAEMETLYQMYRNHPKSRLRERAHLVLLSNGGYSIKEISSLLCRSEKTIAKWLNAYEKEGFLGLYDKPIPGRPPRLSEKQLNEIATWLDNSPRKEGYQQSNWTLKLIAHHLFQQFRTSLSLSRVWEIVHSLGFTLIRPRHTSIVATDEQITSAFDTITGHLAKAKEGQIRFFYLDETTATVWSTLCYCWARKGTRPEIPMANDHGRLYVFAAAEPLSGKVHYRMAENPNKENVVAFLKQMRKRYPNDKLVFILDNAKPHKAKMVENLMNNDGKMQLSYLPPYTSFKCNPIERLFKWFRRVVTHNQFFENVAELKAAIQAFFRAVANLPKRVISLLRLNIHSNETT